MATSASTIWDIRTGGSDTLNGGGFDPGQQSGMFTDGAATGATGNSPVFTSASYNFVAGDVGAWLYIAAGTNWIFGWYQIVSVASNAATLSAAIGAAYQSTISTINSRTPDKPNTVAGCATTASPTGATWSIDYSQQNAAQFAYTDIAAAGAGNLITSVAFPFKAQQVGNILVITAGTNLTTGRYAIVSVAAGVATVTGAASIATGVGTGGTGGLGGCIKTPGQFGQVVNAGNGAGIAFLVSGTTYTTSSASTNVANGVISNSANYLFVGWATNRSLQNTDTGPTIQATVSGVSMFADRAHHYNLILDGNSQTTSTPAATQSQVFDLCTFKSFTLAQAVATCSRCLATANSAAMFGTNAIWCEAYANTATQFTSTSAAMWVNCLSYDNTGATTDGFSDGSNALITNCSAYNNGRDGFRLANVRGAVLQNCHAESNAGYGFNWTTGLFSLINCSAFGNGTNPLNIQAAVPIQNIGFLTPSASVFTNAPGHDFSLNNTSGAGALLRAANAVGLFPRGLTTAYGDRGAAQSQATTASANQLSLILQNIGTY